MLDALKAYRQWVVWRLVQRPGKAKADKIPMIAPTAQNTHVIAASGGYASSTDPQTWCGYDDAVAAMASGNFSGIGFIFTLNDPYIFVDLDSCRDVATAAWLPEAIEICGRFTGAAMEVSQSGTGAHIIGRVANKALFDGHYNKWNGWIEFYRSGRFIAMGGGAWQGNPDTDITAALLEWAPVRPQGATEDGTDVATVGRDPRWCGPEDDAELLKRMMVYKEPDAALVASLAEQLQKNPHDAFLKFRYDQETRHRVPFEYLWNADLRLGQFFPDTAGQQGRSFDWSACDQALMNRLAFWTGKDWPRMQRLFAQSALAQRDKWRLRPYYSNATTSGALRWCREVYKGTREDKRDEMRRAQQMRANENIGDAFREEDHYPPILTLEEMHGRFVYVHTVNGLVDRQTFKVYKSEHSETTFASSVTMIDSGKRDRDTGNPIMKPVNTVRLWRENYNAQKVTVDKITWKPNGGVICEVPESFESGVNMWRGLAKPPYANYYRDHLPEREHAIAAWRAHLEYLVPHGVERVRFEKWLAHILQFPEVLPHTAYLMYTKEVGTGRNWLSSALVRVLRGYVAAGVDIQEVLDGSFNGRLSQKLLAIVDEAKAGMQDGKRYARAERLKALVNQAVREINVKHGLQSVEHNCMRWLFFSNHADALPFDNNDRRIAVIENPKERHPGGAAYYSGLYGLLDNDAFISAVWAHLMYGVDVSDFNPGEHAPMNEAKRAALTEMQGEGGRAVREFAAKCPGDLATAKQVRELIDRYCSDQSGTKAHSRTFKIWIERAGMVSTGIEVRINNTTQRIIIVRNLTPEYVAAMDREIIANIVGKNDTWLKLE